MSDPREQITRIESHVDNIVDTLQTVIDQNNELIGMVRIAIAGQRAKAGPTVATDRMLDGKSGNPIVKAKMPRDWNGPDYRNSTLSACPPELLDMMAERYEYFASLPEASEQRGDKTKGEWDLRSAALCRGWAQRIRNGYVPSAPPAQPGFDDGGFDPAETPDEDSIPF